MGEVVERGLVSVGEVIVGGLVKVGVIELDLEGERGEPAK